MSRCGKMIASVYIYVLETVCVPEASSSVAKTSFFSTGSPGFILLEIDACGVRMKRFYPCKQAHCKRIHPITSIIYIHVLPLGLQGSSCSPRKWAPLQKSVPILCAKTFHLDCGICICEHMIITCASRTIFTHY